MTDELLSRQPAMGKHARHVRSGKCVSEKRQDDADHRQTDSTTRRFNDKQNAETTDGKVKIRDHTGTQDKMLIFPNDVRRRRGTEDRKQYVKRMNLVTRPRFARRIEQINERQAETEMDGALQLRIENTECCRIQLENRERNGDCRNNLGHESLIFHRIGFFIVFF